MLHVDPYFKGSTQPLESSWASGFEPRTHWSRVPIPTTRLRNPHWILSLIKTVNIIISHDGALLFPLINLKSWLCVVLGHSFNSYTHTHTHTHTHFLPLSPSLIIFYTCCSHSHSSFAPSLPLSLSYTCIYMFGCPEIYNIWTLNECMKKKTQSWGTSLYLSALGCECTDFCHHFFLFLHTVINI